MRDHLLAPLLIFTVLAACDRSSETKADGPAAPVAKATVPETTAPETTAPATKATAPVEVKAPETAEPPVATPPAANGSKPNSEPEPDRLYPPGIVPDNDHAAAIKDPPVSPLDHIDKCEDDPPMCPFGMGVLGFHADGRVATIMAPKLPTCGEGLADGLAGRVAKQDSFDRGPKTPFRAGRNDDGSPKVVKWIVERAREGFKPPADIVAFRGEELSGIRGVTSLLGLKAPLAGWMVWASEDAVTKVQLVDPQNKTAYLLGTVRGNGQPSLEEVVLNPERTHLFVMVSFSDGSHCGVDPVSMHRWALPAEAVPKTP